jgi:hypothetical protein
MRANGARRGRGGSAGALGPPPRAPTPLAPLSRLAGEGVCSVALTPEGAALRQAGLASGRLAQRGGARGAGDDGLGVGEDGRAVCWFMWEAGGKVRGVCGARARKFGGSRSLGCSLVAAGQKTPPPVRVSYPVHPACTCRTASDAPCTRSLCACKALVRAARRNRKTNNGTSAGARSEKKRERPHPARHGAQMDPPRTKLTSGSSPGI